MNGKRDSEAADLSTLRRERLEDRRLFIGTALSRGGMGRERKILTAIRRYVGDEEKVLGRCTGPPPVLENNAVNF
jgi:hypothetical protein